MVFWVFHCLHYFANISANFNSIIKFLYIFPQPTEWAVRKCPQIILRMLQGLRNSQKTITPFFWNTLYFTFRFPGHLIWNTQIIVMVINLLCENCHCERGCRQQRFLIYLVKSYDCYSKCLSRAKWRSSLILCQLLSNSCAILSVSDFTTILK